MKSKLLFVFLMAVMLFSAASLGANASASKIYDIDAFLTNQDELDVGSSLALAEAQSGISFYLYVCDSTTGPLVDELDIMSEFALTSSSDAIVLLIEKEGGIFYYELFTYGEAYDLLSDGDCDYILDDSQLRSAVKGGRLAEGARRFAQITSNLVEDNRITGKVLRIVIPIIIGVLAGGITVGVVVYKYKRKLKSPIYPLSKYARLELTHSSDNYVTSHITKVRVQSSSSGGRSGGGGGGRSGGGSRGRR